MQAEVTAISAFIRTAYKPFNSWRMHVQLLNFFTEIGSNNATHATGHNNQGY